MKKLPEERNNSRKGAKSRQANKGFPLCGSLRLCVKLFFFSQLRMPVLRLPQAGLQLWEIAGDEKPPAAPSHSYEVKLTTSATGRLTSECPVWRWERRLPNSWRLTSSVDKSGSNQSWCRPKTMTAGVGASSNSSASDFVCTAVRHLASATATRRIAIIVA